MPYTIKHILMECGVLATVRERHFKADNMKDLFENINMDDVLSFLKEAELYLNIIHHYNPKYSMDQPTNQLNIKKVLSNNPMQNHKSQQLQLVVGPLWPGVMVLVGRMGQNINLKEKWVYEKKVS